MQRFRQESVYKEDSPNEHREANSTLEHTNRVKPPSHYRARVPLSIRDSANFHLAHRGRAIKLRGSRCVSEFNPLAE